MVGLRGDGGPVKLGFKARPAAKEVEVFRTGDANIFSLFASTRETSPNLSSLSSSTASSEDSTALSLTSVVCEGRGELVSSEDHLRSGEGGPAKFGFRARPAAKEVGAFRTGDANIFSFCAST